ncbi:MAG: enoyl-CoA hydratase [Rhizobiales bacterium 65-9]|nr:enoyl-CoA hydratase [Hyphomicrobiales bacterium]OJY35311.1 MAG: enoyl-CoA hydratase [Rhizobiales bacterium 65-9]
MDFEQITYSVADAVAVVTLNRPDKLNAWTDRMEDEVRAAMRRASDDDDVRVIVLTGAGRGFCAGADMNDLTVKSDEGAESLPSGPPPVFDASARRDFQKRYSYFPAAPKPILAAINGPCAGLGLVMALYCDMRFSAPEAVYTTSFSRRGLVAEHGVSWILPTHVGLSKGLDLLLSARRVSADEALSIGMIDRICPSGKLMESVLEYAVELATMVSPRSMRVIKRQVWNARFETLDQAIDVADIETALSLESDDFREGVSHFIERRKPAFTGR